MGARQEGIDASLRRGARNGAADGSTSAARRAMNDALDARGLAPGDFEIEEASSPELSRLLGVIGGILTVRCRSTGEERFYSSGTGSAWFGAFLMDLGRGHFAGALRQAPVRAVRAGGVLRGGAIRRWLHS